MFDPIPYGNAPDFIDGCQMMSHSHAEKDLTRDKNLNLILNKTSH